MCDLFSDSLSHVPQTVLFSPYIHVCMCLCASFTFLYMDGILHGFLIGAGVLLILKKVKKNLSKLPNLIKFGWIPTCLICSKSNTNSLCLSVDKVSMVGGLVFFILRTVTLVNHLNFNIS